MIFIKILFFISSVNAVTIRHNNDTKQRTILKISQLPNEVSGTEKEEVVGWRTRIEDDGWLHALRCLSIITVSLL